MSEFKTKVTSVSVSPFMSELLEKYKFSPTEVFRRGMAVSLYDLGINEFINEKNKERLKYVKIFIESIENNEKMSKIKKILNIDVRG